MHHNAEEEGGLTVGVGADYALYHSFACAVRLQHRHGSSCVPCSAEQLLTQTDCAAPVRAMCGGRAGLPRLPATEAESVGRRVQADFCGFFGVFTAVLPRFPRIHVYFTCTLLQFNFAFVCVSEFRIGHSGVDTSRYLIYYTAAWACSENGNSERSVVFSL